MSFFIENSKNIAYTEETENSSGMRKSQVGAAHAIASHFTVNEEVPALIVMPTGTGKTAVLTMCPFLTKSEKTLVLSSSRLVRGQIVEDFKKLKSLIKLNVITADTRPLVFEYKEALTDEDIEAINEADVVVGIPSSLKKMFDEEMEFEGDYFDLILVDEAHHLPAATWENVISLFPKAKKIYFTATPFRRDKKNLRGKLIYNYPLSRAKEDGTFANIEFHPVLCSDESKRDILIAKEAEKIFKLDKKIGLSHSIMIRTNTKKHAKELVELYESKTDLRLVEISSSKTFAHIKSTINKLDAGEIDGIVCVDMLGEGFDFPKLKIAAVHHPHKSEAITLQFIGRFTRTNSDKIGDAKFIATTNDIKIGKHKLYQEGAVWKDLIIDLSETSIEAEKVEQEIVEAFEDLEGTSLESTGLTLYNLTPYCHVKIFSVKNANLQNTFKLGKQTIENRFYNEDKNTLVVVSKEENRPKWVNSENILDRQYFLYVIYYDEKRKLLFINSTLKSSDAYEKIFSSITGEDKPSYKFQVPKSQIHKVLLDLKNTSFFSIGVQNKLPSSGESYKTTTGSDAQNTIRKGDGLRYSNGHMFCKADSGDSSITIGYSSASKVWSNAYLRISELLSWCNVIGEKIISNRTVQTNSPFDHIPIPQKVEKIISNIISGHWINEAYIDLPEAVVGSNSLSLVDFEISIVNQNDKGIEFNLTHEDSPEIKMHFDIENGYSILEKKFQSTQLSSGVALINYLNENPIVFQNTDFDSIIGNELHKGYIDENLNIDPSQLEVIDWKSSGTNITVEFGSPDSIHSSLEKILIAQKFDVLIYDHGKGEIADFISVKNIDKQIFMEFYHVKGSSDKTPSDRLGDLYEVCGQANKTVQFSTDAATLKKKFRSRLIDNPSKFKMGSAKKLFDILDIAQPIRITMVIVQPGTSKKKTKSKVGSLLASTDMFLRSVGSYSPLKVWCSD